MEICREEAPRRWPMADGNRTGKVNGAPTFVACHLYDAVTAEVTP
jgi:hypothetical protein